MPKAGSTDVSEDIKESERMDKAITKSFAPQLPKADPEGTENSKRRMLWMAGIVAVVLLLVFTFTFFRSEEVATIQDVSGHTVAGVIDERYSYNGFNFVKIDEVWYTEMLNNNRRLTIPLHYGPKEMEDIKITGEVDDRFTRAKLVHIAFNPVDHNLSYVALANGELSLSLSRAMGLKLKAACVVNETNPCAKQPILSCDTDREKAIVELKQSDETSIQYKGNCILITGRDWDLVRAVDRLLLKWYRIME